MGCLIDSGILELKNGKKVLTEKAENNFLEEVQDILIYGTEGIPEDKKPFFTSGIVVPPNPNPESVPDFKNDFKNEKIFFDFYKTYLGRYKKIAIDLDLESNFSLAPIAADPIALAGSAFGVQLPAVDFPNGFLPYFTPSMPQLLLANLIKSGETDFIGPDGLMKVVDTILSNVKPPQIPKIEIPEIVPPTPPIINAEGQSFQTNIQIPEIGIPAPPQVSLSALAAKEFAAAQNIPKLLADIIAKIPSFLTKIVDPKELMKEVTKTVVDSGVLGSSESTSQIQKAADSVLAAKIAEMAIAACLASTIGSSRGSAVTGLTQKTSGPNPKKVYLSPPPPEQPKVRKKRPREIAIEFANGIVTGDGYSNWGSSYKRTNYLNALFSLESTLAKYPEKTLNIFGDVVEEGEPYTEQEIRSARGSMFARPSNEEAKKRLKATPVLVNRGFFDFADREASKQSSCGMFVRGCLFQAGCNNKFFLGLYPASSAISLILSIGALRNLRWVQPKDENGVLDPTRPGIINDLNKNDEQSKRLKETLDWFARQDSLPNQTSKVLDDGTIQQIGPGNFLAYWNWFDHPFVLNDKKFSDYVKTLQPYIKPADERAMLSEGYIRTLKDATFPAILSGEAVLVVGYDKNKNKPWDETTNKWGKEHILLVTEDRSPGYFFKDDGITFKDYFSTIEGGGIDNDNPYDEKYESNFDASKLKDNPDIVLKQFEKDTGTTIKNKDGAKEEAKNKDYTGTVKLEGTRKTGYNTAVIRSKRLYGGYKNSGGNTEGKKSAFLLGTSQYFGTAQKVAAQLEMSGKQIGDPTEKKIIAIIKTDNYCDEIENGGSPEATQALEYMDSLPYIRRTIENEIENNRSAVYQRAHYCFYPGGTIIPLGGDKYREFFPTKKN